MVISPAALRRSFPLPSPALLDRSGLHPAMIRAYSRALALSVMPGSVCELYGGRQLAAGLVGSRIAAASASVTTYVLRR